MNPQNGTIIVILCSTGVWSNVNFVLEYMSANVKYNFTFSLHRGIDATKSETKIQYSITYYGLINFMARKLCVLNDNIGYHINI